MFTTMQKNRAKLWQYGKKTAGFDVRAHHVDVFFTPSLRKNGKKTYDSFWYSDILWCDWYWTMRQVHDLGRFCVRVCQTVSDMCLTAYCNRGGEDRRRDTYTFWGIFAYVCLKQPWECTSKKLIYERIVQTCITSPKIIMIYYAIYINKLWNPGRTSVICLCSCRWNMFLNLSWYYYGTLW